MASPEEVVLEELQKLDKAKSKQIDAGTFQEVLERVGIPLGTALADSVVLQCKVQPNGMIDFGEFEQATLAKRTPPAILGAGPPASSREKVARPNTRPPMPPQQHSATQASSDYSSMDPKDRVKVATPHLRDIFQRYDTGRITIQQLQEEVARLGLELTPAFHSLLRSATMDMTFSQLYQALIHVEESHVPRIEISPEQWKSGAFSTTGKPKSPISKESIDSPWNTAQVPDSQREQVFGMPSPKSSRKRVDTDLMHKSSIVFGNEDKMPNHPTGSVELLKEQVYSCIRKLDQGSVSTAEFEKRLQTMGVPLLPEVARLLAKTKADGTVHFQNFALAFEPFFRSISPVAPPVHKVTPPLPPVPSVSSTLPTSSHFAYDAQVEATRKVLSKAQISHGDVIAWSEMPGTLEQAEATLLEKGKRHVVGTQDRVDLTWADPDQIVQQPPPAVSTRRTSRSNISTGNILSWTDGSSNTPSTTSSSSQRRSATAISYPFGVEYSNS